MHQSGTSPEWVQLNKRIMSRLETYTSIALVRGLLFGTCNSTNDGRKTKVFVRRLKCLYFLLSVQVQRLVDSELLTMSGITLAMVMLKAAIQVRTLGPSALEVKQQCIFTQTQFPSMACCISKCWR